MNTEHCIHVCNGLLRAERSAIQIYDQAVACYKAGEKPPEITRILREHADSAVLLEENVRSMGGVPDLESNDLKGSGQHSGNRTGVFNLLQENEQRGKNGYKSALNDEDVMPECKNLIRSSLLPRLSEHIQVLRCLQRAA